MLLNLLFTGTTGVSTVLILAVGTNNWLSVTSFFFRDDYIVVLGGLLGWFDFLAVKRFTFGITTSFSFFVYYWVFCFFNEKLVFDWFSHYWLFIEKVWPDNWDTPVIYFFKGCSWPVKHPMEPLLPLRGFRYERGGALIWLSENNIGTNNWFSLKPKS